MFSKKFSLGNNKLDPNDLKEKEEAYQVQISDVPTIDVEEPERPLGAGSPRKAILVLGMHRSGTSALAGLLAALGCDGPRTPMMPNIDNPKGFFESQPVYQIHEEILAAVGSSWRDYQPFPASWFSSPQAEEYRAKLRNILESEYGDSSLFVVKDPRICRILPLWLDVFLSMNIQPMVVHTHRNPMEVAQSLSVRNEFTTEFSCLLWLRHILEAEVGTRHLVRSFTSFDHVVDNWIDVTNALSADLDILWPNFSPDKPNELEEFVDGSLRHHKQADLRSLDDPLMLPWFRDTYRIVENWANFRENVNDRARLDQIRTIFDQACAAFRGLPPPRNMTRGESA